MQTRSMSEDPAVTNQIEHIREKMRLLQGDRKANIDLLEATKQANQEEIRRLKDDNKGLRAKLIALHKNARNNEENRDLVHMQREVDRARQQQDAYKATSRRLERTLQALRDQVRELQLESVKPHLEDNKYTRQIRTLENKLDRAMIKLNEAQAIKRTYEQIVRRLREERVSFDTQVEAIERSYAAKQKDFEELLLLSGDASHAREVSLHELERVKTTYETEREQRERSLKERLQVVQLRKQMLDRIKQREKMREDIAMKLSQENPQSASANAQASGDVDNQLQMEKLEKRQKIDIFENAFRKIKDATGVSDVNEVIQKIVSQESTTESLMSLTKENQTKLEMLNQQKQQLKARVEEIKYSGPGGGHRRKMVDDNEQQLANSTMRLERAKLRYERLNRTVIAAKAGVAHLQDKLEIIREELGGKKVELFDETVADVLYESEILLTAVLKRVKAAREEQRRRAKAGDPRALEYEAMTRPGSAMTMSYDESDLMGARPFNQRIGLLSEEVDGADGQRTWTPLESQHLMEDRQVDTRDDDDDNDDDDDDDEFDHEITRDQIKRASSAVLAAAERSSKRKGKKKANKDYVAGTPGTGSPSVLAHTR